MLHNYHLHLPTPVVPPPELLISPENISMSAYSEVKLSCTGRGFGDVKVVWTRPPSKLTTTAQYATERYDDRIVSTLTIPHALEIYSGSYCCAIVNHVGSSDVQCASLQVKSNLYKFSHTANSTGSWSQSKAHNNTLFTLNNL